VVITNNAPYHHSRTEDDFKAVDVIFTDSITKNFCASSLIDQLQLAFAGISTRNCGSQAV
jgi:hypothetical protein